MSKQIAISTSTWQRLRDKQTEKGLEGDVPSFDQIINELIDKEKKDKKND